MRDELVIMVTGTWKQFERISAEERAKHPDADVLVLFRPIPWWRVRPRARIAYATVRHPVLAHLRRP